MVCWGGRWHGGDRLTEFKAAELFQVSRTPVREELVELAAMGIVELKRNCGAVLHAFGSAELRDIYAVRALLEVEATRLAATRMDAAEIERLTRAFEELRRANYPDTGWKLDCETPRTIAYASGNPRLAGDISRYATLVQTMRNAVGRTIADIHSTSLTEHLRILGCLKQRDAEAAVEAMRQHLAQAAESAVKAVYPNSRSRLVFIKRERSREFGYTAVGLSRSSNVLLAAEKSRAYSAAWFWRISALSAWGSVKTTWK